MYVVVCDAMPSNYAVLRILFVFCFFCIVFLLQKSRSQPTTTVLEPASAQVYVLCSLRVYPPQTEQQSPKCECCSI